jgi:hypothetical protein
MSTDHENLPPLIITTPPPPITIATTNPNYSLIPYSQFHIFNDNLYAANVEIVDAVLDETKSLILFEDNVMSNICRLTYFIASMIAIMLSECPGIRINVFEPGFRASGQMHEAVNKCLHRMQCKPRIVKNNIENVWMCGKDGILANGEFSEPRQELQFHPHTSKLNIFRTHPNSLNSRGITVGDLNIVFGLGSTRLSHLYETVFRPMLGVINTRLMLITDNTAPDELADLDYPIIHGNRTITEHKKGENTRKRKGEEELAVVVEEEEEEDDENDIDSRCSICMCKRKLPTIVMFNGDQSCGHCYCNVCIKEWVTKNANNPTCPQCRRHVQRLRKLEDGTDYICPEPFVPLYTNPVVFSGEPISFYHPILEESTVTLPPIQQGQYLTPAGRAQFQARINEINASVAEGDRLIAVQAGLIN